MTCKFNLLQYTQCIYNRILTVGYNSVEKLVCVQKLKVINKIKIQFHNQQGKSGLISSHRFKNYERNLIFVEPCF